MPEINHPRISLGDITYLGRMPFSRDYPWYDYDPCAMLNQGIIKVWWLGRFGPNEQSSTDNVLYAEYPSGSSWSEPRSVLAPRVGTQHFDRAHVGNCSIIKVKGKYYMYYSAGRDDDPEDPNRVTNAVGYAESTDGVDWSRPTPPIFLAYHDRVQDWRTQNKYGAGTPSAAYVDGLYYLLYQDTTGAASNWNAGIYVVRSADPWFEDNLEVLTSRGWERRNADNMTEFSVHRHNAPDVMWYPELRQFMWLYHSTGEIMFADAAFNRLPYSISLGIPHAFEGTGFVRDPHGHIIPDREGFWLDVFAGRSEGVSQGEHPVWRSDIQRVRCHANVPLLSWPRRFDRHVLQTEDDYPGISWNGKLLRFQHTTLGHIPYLLSNHFQQVERAVFDSFDLSPGVITPGRRVISDGQRPAAFVLKEPNGTQPGEIWAIDWSGVPNFWEQCGTRITYVSAEDYSRYVAVGHSYTV